MILPRGEGLGGTRTVSRSGTYGYCEPACRRFVLRHAEQLHPSRAPETYIFTASAHVSGCSVGRRHLDCPPWALRAMVCLGNRFVLGRSEERRVGKECRSRWS